MPEVLPIKERAEATLDEASGPETEEPEACTPEPHRWLTLAVLLTAGFLGVLDFFIINLALPSIQTDLQATSAQVQLVIAGYGLAYAVCLITGGRLGDIFGRKRMFLIGVAWFTAASGLCGLAPSANLLVGARVLQGMAGALLVPQILSIVQIIFPQKERALAFALFGVVQGAASFTGIVLGGILVQSNLFGLGWRPIFLVNLPVGILALWAAHVLMHESRSSKARKLDLVGVAIISVCLYLFVYPLVQGREAGWPLWAFACLAAAGPMLFVFVLYELSVMRRGGSPLVELFLFRNRVFVVGLFISMTFCGGLSAFFLTVTLFCKMGFISAPRRPVWRSLPSQSAT